MCTHTWHSKANPREGFGIFGQFAISGGNPNRLHGLAFARFGGTGLIRGRPIDNWGIGCYCASFASGLKDLDPPFPDIRDEQGLEVFCNYAMTPWLVIGADVQFIRPGIGHHNAIFTGLRTVIKF